MARWWGGQMRRRRGSKVLRWSGVEVAKRAMWLAKWRGRWHGIMKVEIVN